MSFEAKSVTAILSAGQRQVTMQACSAASQPLSPL
jgi:hypothetical protein